MVRKKTATNSASDTATESISTQPTIAARGRTLVFISHDSRDADLAEAFASLNPAVQGALCDKASHSALSLNVGDVIA